MKKYSVFEFNHIDKLISVDSENIPSKPELRMHSSVE